MASDDERAAPADWITRLEAISDTLEAGTDRATEVVLDEQHPPPLEASAALVRYVCARYAIDKDVQLLRRAAAILKAYRTGDPVTDTRLFWWGASTVEQLKTLRWLLELAGPAGAREELVSAAELCGLVGGQVTMYLSAPVRRPPWADGDVE